jgi:hypothetical protein
MRRITCFIIIVLATSFFNFSSAQDAKEMGLNAITEQAVQGQLEFLASDWTEGRATGQPGAYMAADYIASIFKIYGLQPGGDVAYTKVSRAERREGKRPEKYGTFYQSFDLIEYEPGKEQSLALVNKGKEGTQTTIFGYHTDFGVRTSDVAVEIESPIVFVGYGFKDDKSGYNDFKGVDVKGKIILRMSGYPGHKDPESIAFQKIGEQSRWGIYRAKNEAAAEMGVSAVIEIDPETDFAAYWADNLPFRYNSGNYEGEKARASYYSTRMKLPGDDLAGSPTQLNVSNRVLNEILKGTGIDLVAFEESVVSSLKPDSKAIRGKVLRLKTSVDSKMIKARNVLGVLPGKDTSEIIVVGGHYDHLGIHDGWIWNGADDNASGTVGVMTIAKACMATGEKPEKTIVFCAWTGEEKGLLGSHYFADHPYNDAKMLLNLNYDMISRDNADDTQGVKCSMVYTEKHEIIKTLADQHNEKYGLGLDIRYRPSERPRGGSDHSSFSAKDVPVFYFMAGFPPEYHQPDDHVELVNFDKMTKIIRLGYLNIWELANTEW